MNTINELFSLSSKVALVTGVARGNGRAIAEGLLAAGASVVGLDIMPYEGEYDIDFHLCDITNTGEMEKIFTNVVNKYEKIDILVNNAGVSYSQDFLEYSSQTWDYTHDVNLKAPFELMLLVGRNMKENDSGGSIINITSLNSEMAFPNNPAYISSKGALKQLTKSAALDLGKYNIRVNNVGPGYMKTEMTRNSWSNSTIHDERKNKTILQRWGQPSDLVGITIFLASNASAYITGQDIYVDGGWLIKGL